MNYERIRSGMFTAVRMAHRWPWRPGAAGAGTAVIGLGIWRLGFDGAGPRITVFGAVVLVAVTGYWWARFVARPHTTQALIRRRAELDQRCSGSATLLDVAELASRKTLRLRATILRPSFARLSRWQRRRANPRELGVLVIKTGLGLWGEQVWSACEDATLRIAGPRSGKTLSLACHAVDAPGALITTSTRLDLAEHCHAARSAKGRVHVFNPSGLGNVASTVTWRVLSGCEDYSTAARRAADLMPTNPGEGERWDAQGRRILAILLHAAALSGKTMRDVVRWTTDTREATRNEITDALDLGGDGGRDRADAMRTHWSTNERTRSSINSTMAVPLAWMADDRARALGDPRPDDPDLINIEDLISRGQTLHLIGHEQHTGLAPLIAALVSELAHAARSLAAELPGGRLDPPLTMVLDEAAIAAPVPLDHWTADMGGRGVTIHISAQSLAQLRGRWGDNGAGAILANVSCFLVFGGSPSADDLRDISLLTGEHRMRVVGAERPSRDGEPDDVQHGGQRGRRGPRPGRPAQPEWREEYRWVPVLSPAQIRSLKPGEVLVLKRGLHTLVGHAPLITERRGWTSVPLPRVASNGVPTVAELDRMVSGGGDPVSRFRGSRLARALAKSRMAARVGVRRERSTRPAGRDDEPRPQVRRPDGSSPLTDTGHDHEDGGR